MKTGPFQMAAHLEGPLNDVVSLLHALIHVAAHNAGAVPAGTKLNSTGLQVGIHTHSIQLGYV